MSEANERLFLFCVPPGSLEELATTAIPAQPGQPFLFVASPRGSLEELATTAIPLLQHRRCCNRYTQLTTDVTVAIGI
jgi:hypothetical protein